MRINRHIHAERIDDALARYGRFERRLDELESEGGLDTELAELKTSISA